MKKTAQVAGRNMVSHMRAGRKAAEAAAEAAKADAKAVVAKSAATKKTAKAVTKKADAPKKKAGVVANIVGQLESAKDGLKYSAILDRLSVAFPDRRREAMANTIRGAFAMLTKNGRLVVAKTEGEAQKVYSVKAGK